jgi:hypothetical protein
VRESDIEQDVLGACSGVVNAPWLCYASSVQSRELGVPNFLLGLIMVRAQLVEPGSWREVEAVRCNNN